MQFPGNVPVPTRPVLLVLLLMLCRIHAVSQDGPVVNIVPRVRPDHSSAKESSDFRTDVKMVLVPTSVMDRGDKPVMDLHKEDFHLFQDAVEQTIEVLSIDQAPVSVGIVFDASGSMTNKFTEACNAVKQFLRTSSPGDEFFLVQFNDTPEVRVGFTPDQDEIMANLSSVQPKGWTAMLDAISLAVSRMKHAKNPRRVLLVFSDGGDNNSRYTDSEVISLLREANVQVYAVGLLDDSHFLQKAADVTGGSIVVVHNTKELPEAIEKLSSQLRSQYVLGYYPTDGQNDGKYHRLTIQVLQKLRLDGLHISWRHGFYAP